MLTRLLLILMFIVSGCATQDKSAGLGGAIGAGGGALVGSIADPGSKGQFRTRNIILGSAIGGMAGLVAGSLAHQELEKKKAESFEKGKQSGSQPAPTPPQLQEPKVESRWVEGRVQGNRYIEGHFEHVIIEPTRWKNQGD